MRSWDLSPMPDHHMNYIESELPEQATLVDWRRARTASSRRRRWDLRILVPTRRAPVPAV